MATCSDFAKLPGASLLHPVVVEGRIPHYLEISEREEARGRDREDVATSEATYVP